MSHKQTPRDFLKLIIGHPVVVKLHSGTDYRGAFDCQIFIHSSSLGVLLSLDGYMNVVLEQTEEYCEGQLKNKYGDCFIRGNNEIRQMKKKRNVAKELVSRASSVLPAFTDVFDEETFYICFFALAILSFITAFVAIKYFGVTIRDGGEAELKVTKRRRIR